MSGKLLAALCSGRFYGRRKPMRPIHLLAAALLGAGALTSGPALAQGGHQGGHHGGGHGAHLGLGITLGVPLWHSWYEPVPYYYVPPPVVVAPPPAVYVERGDDGARGMPSQGQEGWWYYCEQAGGYYPYVKTCPAGWRRVPPAPAPG